MSPCSGRAGRRRRGQSQQIDVVGDQTRCSSLRRENELSLAVAATRAGRLPASPLRNGLLRPPNSGHHPPIGLPTPSIILHSLGSDTRQIQLFSTAVDVSSPHFFLQPFQPFSPPMLGSESLPGSREQSDAHACARSASFSNSNTIRRPVYPRRSLRNRLIAYV